MGVVVGPRRIGRSLLGENHGTCDGTQNTVRTTHVQTWTVPLYVLMFLCFNVFTVVYRDPSLHPLHPLHPLLV